MTNISIINNAYSQLSHAYYKRDRKAIEVTTLMVNLAIDFLVKDC